MHHIPAHITFTTAAAGAGVAAEFHQKSSHENVSLIESIATYNFTHFALHIVVHRQQRIFHLSIYNILPMKCYENEESK